MSNTLPLKYRPNFLEDIFGNRETVKMVSTILDRDLDKIPHSWLFTGPSGCGKTTIARIVKEELGCSDLDYTEFNSSNDRGIETIRGLQQISKLAPTDGEVKVFLLDEVHQITGPAQEAMLKMLEDAPDNTFFLLATTNPEKLKASLKSRCTTIQMNPLNSKEMVNLIDIIAKAEKYGVTSDINKAIISASEGSPRTALKILDTILQIEDEEVAIKAIQNSTVNETGAIELCRAINKGESWKEIVDILKGLNEDPESIRRVCLGYFTKVLLDSGNMGAARRAECFVEPFYNTGKPGLILAAFEASLENE